jgi:hypothetical protein
VAAVRRFWEMELSKEDAEAFWALPPAAAAREMMKALEKYVMQVCELR